MTNVVVGYRPAIEIEQNDDGQTRLFLANVTDEVVRWQGWCLRCSRIVALKGWLVFAGFAGIFWDRMKAKWKLECLRANVLSWIWSRPYTSIVFRTLTALLIRGAIAPPNTRAPSLPSCRLSNPAPSACALRVKFFTEQSLPHVVADFAQIGWVENACTCNTIKENATTQKEIFILSGTRRNRVECQENKGPKLQKGKGHEVWVWWGMSLSVSVSWLRFASFQPRKHGIFGCSETFHGDSEHGICGK